MGPFHLIILAVLTALTLQQETCEDNNSNCKYYKPYCERSDMSWAKERCPVTCGACTKKEVTTPAAPTLTIVTTKKTDPAPLEAVISNVNSSLSIDSEDLIIRIPLKAVAWLLSNTLAVDSTTPTSTAAAPKTGAPTKATTAKVASTSAAPTTTAPTTSVPASKPRECSDLYAQNEEQESGMVYPYPNSPDEAVEVSCDQKTDGGRWTLIQRRDNARVKQIDFHGRDKGWKSFVEGFRHSSKDGEFWIGLKYLHALTREARYELYIQLWPSSTSRYPYYAKYGKFEVAGYEDNYKLTVAGYRGNAGDSLAYHNGKPFSTFDKDNDSMEYTNCALKYTGGWWFHRCLQSNLNGRRPSGSMKTSNGIVWQTRGGRFASMAKATMMIRKAVNKDRT